MDAELITRPEPEAVDDEEGFGMSNLQPEDTGLSRVVWIGSGEGVRHDVRVKVSATRGGRMSRRDAAVVGVRPEPQLIHGDLPRDELEQVIAWIRLNEDTIIRYWNDEISTRDMLAAIQPV